MGLGLLTPCHIYHSDPLSLETFSGSVHGYCLINENDVLKKADQMFSRAREIEIAVDKMTL